MAIQLSPDTVKHLQGPIQRFVAEEYGVDLGALGAETFLRFCLAEIGPAIYNQAVADAQACLQAHLSELPDVCFAEEGGYWNQGGARGVARRPAGRR